MALSVLGLLIAGLTAWRRRPRAALRWFGVALLPTGLWLTGLLTVARKIGSAIAVWAAHLVFDPRVWAGFILLAAGVLILLATGVHRGGHTTREPKKQPKATPPGTTTALTPKPKPQAPDDDMKEIEEILKRRGI